MWLKSVLLKIIQRYGSPNCVIINLLFLIALICRLKCLWKSRHYNFIPELFVIFCLVFPDEFLVWLMCKQSWSFWNVFPNCKVFKKYCAQIFGIILQKWWHQCRCQPYARFGVTLCSLPCLVHDCLRLITYLSGIRPCLGSMVTPCASTQRIFRNWYVLYHQPWCI